MKEKKKRLTQREAKYRREIVYGVWEEYKNKINRMEMKELAHIFKMELSEVYKLLRDKKRGGDKE